MNLWSFSNSGTGASCSIDRVPNDLIRKLIKLNQNSKIGAELRRILNNGKSSSSFLDNLEANKEWWLLYPNKFKDGKKTVDYDGVSVDFLEAYFEVTGNIKQIAYAKYIAGLILKYKSKSFDKYLGKYDAWNELEYRVDLYMVLVAATEKNEWDLRHQVQILDDKNLLPVKNTYYYLHKLIHFYYRKEQFGHVLPNVEDDNSLVLSVCYLLIKLIENDVNRIKMINALTSRNDYASVRYTGLLLRALQNYDITLAQIATAFYDDSFRLNVYGLNELLRIYFLQPEREVTDNEISVFTTREFLSNEEVWFNTIDAFAFDYKRYYYEKYKHRETEQAPVEKFKKLIHHISLETSAFLEWLREALDHTNEFILNTDGIKDKWQEESLLFNPNGELSLSFSKLAIKVALTKESFIHIEQPIS